MKTNNDRIHLATRTLLARSATLLIIPALLIVGVPAAFAQAMYSIIDLGTLGGSQSCALGINNHG
jgi:hypothetical protein